MHSNGTAMNSLSPSRQALTRSDLRLVDTRRYVLGAACVTLVLATAAFAGGLWLGRGQTQTVMVPVAQVEEAPDESGERFAAERIGELTGRLQVLEKDADYLLKAVDSHQEIARKLSKVDPELVPAPKGKSTSTRNEGGILLPPRACVDPLPASAADLERNEQSAACLRRVFDLLMD